MKLQATIVGAGVSGLTLAYYLHKNGYGVTVLEKSPRPGGLLQSPQTQHGPIDLAANGLLLSQELIGICQEINLKILYPSESAKKKFIFYKGKLSRWPFSTFYTFYIVFMLLQFNLLKSRKLPREQESLGDWCRRVFSEKLLNHLIEPAFQGVYATSAENLSAKLVTKSLFKKKTSHSKKVKRQTVSFAGGIADFTNQLASYLSDQKGVKIKYSQSVESLSLDHTHIVTCSPLQCEKLLSQYCPSLATDAKNLNFLSIAKVALFYKKEDLNPEGFGCLFPKKEGLNSLGVLFDSSLFPSRYDGHSLLTWIVGHKIIEESNSDSELVSAVREDIKKVWNLDIESVGTHIKVWSQTIPKYDTQLEIFLDKYDLNSPVASNLYLHGNFAGELGLSQLLLKSKTLAERINYEQTK